MRVKSQRYQNEVAKILHGTEVKLKFQEIAKLKGPKLGPLQQRYETVNGTNMTRNGSQSADT